MRMIPQPSTLPQPHLLHSPHHPTTTTTTTTTPGSTSPGLQFRHKLLYLESLNINSLKALNQNPEFRSAPLESLLSVEQTLLSFSLPRSSLGRIFNMYPQLLTADPHTHLYPTFDFLLNDVVLPYSHLSRSIIRCPRLLVSSVDQQLHPTFTFLRNLGLRIDSHTTVLLVSSVEKTLIPKLHFLHTLGFSDAEVANMVIRSPGLLTYSVEKNLRPKVEFFLAEMGGDLAELKRFPQYFSFSLERKIKPRFRLLVDHGLSMPLSDMLKVSEGEFNLRLLEMRLRMIDCGGLL